MLGNTLLIGNSKNALYSCKLISLLSVGEISKESCKSSTVSRFNSSLQSVSRIHSSFSHVRLAKIGTVITNYGGVFAVFLIVAIRIYYIRSFGNDFSARYLSCSKALKSSLCVSGKERIILFKVFKLCAFNSVFSHTQIKHNSIHSIFRSYYLVSIGYEHKIFLCTVNCSRIEGVYSNAHQIHYFL